MGRRKRRRVKVKRGVPKQLMRYYQCPLCGSMTLTVGFEKGDSAGVKIAVVTCGSCGFNCRIKVSRAVERIDVYNRITDLAYEGRLEEECRGEAVEGAEQGGVEGETMEYNVGEEETE